MKKLMIALILLNLTTFQCYEYRVYANTLQPSKQGNISQEYLKERLYKDILSSLLLPYIQKSVSDYYSNYLTDIPTVDPWDINIISAERQNGYQSFVFILKIEVNPYVGPHIAAGTDDIILTVDGIGNVKINNFNHVKDFKLPPNYKDIIKKN